MPCSCSPNAANALYQSSGFPERIVAEVGEAQADADRAVTVIITAGVLSVIAGFAYRLSGGR